MDFSQALTFQFKDPRWVQKFLLAALLSLIPIFGQAVVFGWSLAISQRVMRGDAELLPELDLTNDLLRGLKAWGFSLIYLLPALIITAPIVVGIGFVVVGTEGRSGYLWLLAGLCLVALLIVYGLALIFVLPASYGNFLANGEKFQAGLDVKEAVRLLRRNPAAYFLVMIGGILCMFITSLGLAGCIIGVIVTSLYSLTIMAHLYGQAYRITNI